MKKIKLLLTSVLGLLVLASCVWPFPLNGSNGTSSYIPPSDDGAGHYQATTIRDNYQMLNNSQGYQTLPSTGHQKILVVPVSFTDYPETSLPGGAAKVQGDLQRAFFGESGQTSWQSVASFYNASSTGQLNITGEVTNWINLGISTSQLISQSQARNDNDPTYLVIEKVYAKLSASLLNSYDQDKDGRIDALWLIYSPKSSYEDQSLDADTFWAYTYWYFGFENNFTPTSGKAYAGVYAWASYNFMYEGYTGLGIDAHTYIHETGHMFGLDDYYNYERSDTTPDVAAPMGYVDMMDANIIDHNAFSKMALGWIKPTVVTDTTTIILPPATQQNKAILINDNWNGSVFDEYILAEFYTPDGLNRQDSVLGPYPGNNVRGFTIRGLRIYHVDARLVTSKYNSAGDVVSTTFTDTIKDGYAIGEYSYYTEIAFSNTPKYRIANPGFNLITIVDGTTRFTANNVAENDSLYTLNESISFDKFHDGSNIGYQLTVKLVDNDQIAVEIIKL